MKTAHRQRSIGGASTAHSESSPRIAPAKPVLEAAFRCLASGAVLIGREMQAYEMQECEKQETAAVCRGGGDSDGA
jgi:hypothetical protein